MLPAYLFDPRIIFLEPAIREGERGREILARFPEARQVEVASHWSIPALREGAAADWLAAKRDVLVLGVKKTLACRPNGRSADFIAPSVSNGCAMACAYCYVARRKGHANPVTVFTNIDAITGFIARHAARQGMKLEPNQVDARDWVYDIGENGDLSVDAAISGNVRDLVALFRDLPNAKGSFATKFANPAILDYDPRGRTRVRVSLMPEARARLLDVRTSPVAERIGFAGEVFRAGYELHLNFSPVVVHEGWEAEWRELFRQIDGQLPEAAKQGLAAEVIMLTHSAELHGVNLAWHPRAEELLWQPRWQEEKTSQNGARNLRYRHGVKGRLLQRFIAILGEEMPYCRIRYAF